MMLRITLGGSGGCLACRDSVNHASQECGSQNQQALRILPCCTWQALLVEDICGWLCLAAGMFMTALLRRGPDCVMASAAMATPCCQHICTQGMCATLCGPCTLQNGSQSAGSSCMGMQIGLCPSLRYCLHHFTERFQLPHQCL